MKRLLMFALTVVTTAPVASAQEDDIRSRISDGRVLISQLNFVTQVTSEAKAFSGRLDQDFVGNDPGYNSFSGDLPPSAEVEWDFLPIYLDGQTSTLMYWDGLTSEPNFGTTAAVLTYFGQNAASIDADGGDEIVNGPILFRADRQTAVSPGGGTHTHRDFFVHDGSFNENATPDEGFYLASLRLRVDGFVRSDPFFIVLGTDGSSTATQLNLVLPWVEDQADSLVLRGDHNFDGRVDAADYTVWRDGSGVTHTAADYDDWIIGYGAVADELNAAAGFVVPEPATLTATLIGLSLLGSGLRRNRAA